jgi:hypothetical protein
LCHRHRTGLACRRCSTPTLPAAAGQRPSDNKAKRVLRLHHDGLSTTARGSRLARRATAGLPTVADECCCTCENCPRLGARSGREAVQGRFPAAARLVGSAHDPCRLRRWPPSAGGARRGDPGGALRRRAQSPRRTDPNESEWPVEATRQCPLKSTALAASLEPHIAPRSYCSTETFRLVPIRQFFQCPQDLGCGRRSSSFGSPADVPLTSVRSGWLC